MIINIIINLFPFFVTFHCRNADLTINLPVSFCERSVCVWIINPLAPNDIYIYICRTAQLTSRRCILNVYSTNILTEYFKHAAHSPFFSLFKMPFIS